jgi:protein TonB
MFSSLTFTGTQVITGFGLIVLAILALIAIGRYRLRRLSNEDLKTRHANDSKQEKARSLRKYREVDVLHDTNIFWKVGLVTVLATVVLAFGWTTFDEKVEIPEGAMDLNFDIIEEAPQRTAEPPPPPPPPPL